MVQPALNLNSTDTLAEHFKAKIHDKAFPCVGAKSALARQHMQFLSVGDIRCSRDDTTAYEALHDFARAYTAAPRLFQSLVIFFDTPPRLSEVAFEQAMWARIEAFENIDASRGYAYDPRVSSDADAPTFSLSFAQEAFFVVGLHPLASRKARRFEVPTLVFNVHAQFETLRAEGLYEPMRKSIMKRDIAFSGSANPMLARHGESSEASQYSGRLVGRSWKCPARRMHSVQSKNKTPSDT